MQLKYSAEGLLEDGIQILSERGKEYDPAGKSERSMEKIVKAFAVVTGKDLTEAEGWMFMAILKGVRQFQRPGFHADSAQDFVNYAALCGEAKAKEGNPATERRASPQRSAEVAIGTEPEFCHKTIWLDKLEKATDTPVFKAEVEQTKNANATYLAKQLSQEAMNEIRAKAFTLYRQAAEQMSVAHSLSWGEMHPVEQRAWLQRAIGGEDKLGDALPIIDPLDRVKDPKTGLDINLLDVVL